MRIMITGGFGAVGRLTAPKLAAAGHEVILTSRTERQAPNGMSSLQLDLGGPLPEGLLDSSDVVIHAATNPAKARRVDIEGTDRLVQAALSSDTHLIYLSIVGIDEHPFPYYRAKLAAEKTIERSSVDYSILRATQFHEFLDRIFRTGPVITAFRGIDFQVIDGGVVADVLVEVCESGPSKRLPDLGGPVAESMTEMAASWKAASGSRKPILRVPALGKSAQAFKDRFHHTPNRAEGTRTWSEWLTANYPR